MTKDELCGVAAVFAFFAILPAALASATVVSVRAYNNDDITDSFGRAGLLVVLMAEGIAVPTYLYAVYLICKEVCCGNAADRQPLLPSVATNDAALHGAVRDAGETTEPPVTDHLVGELVV
ncbi:MAG: hypothetical protein ACD_70C00114G0004 [uncultured bacterium]|nr:MAG: hypothetical protein ACD_70C00114G0004 [uncultured bacterium]OGT25539.1 MAG: hypothetical protein A3B71_05750 [Gammaproteobacteria bacterium RIFCSPHIGHO2_02_FULL_42_43]OGT28452.1 MAG: hypothetical protein A2624_01255 [Gammaproteobacteria bacterium RIFCSPHIGHO2_01_FULL_42_8]OGT51493.1 MAG: hypothetical protein A3E54_05515 [Gammaproteobacteria bacterium RIFCSPHIGHO2_12_FULL_41_25]OGT62194.1 MAG: hypothetical protein A3I77_04450 [Gammaproteobacteria bacterium RIFCSPLOWO2_02_FULL_42_14]OGT